MPGKPKNYPKTHWVRVSEETDKELREEAETQGIYIGAFIRMLVVEALKARKKNAK